MRLCVLIGFLLAGCADQLTSNGGNWAAGPDAATHDDAQQPDRTAQRCEPCQQNKHCVAGLFCDSGVCLGPKDVWLDCPGACSGRPDCDVSGLCTADPKRGCVVGSDADCWQSEMCAALGKCSMVLVNGEALCLPQTAADCAQSAKCLTDGLCGIVKVGGNVLCRPTSDAHCAGSSLCHTQGLCSLSAEHTCK